MILYFIHPWNEVINHSTTKTNGNNPGRKRGDNNRTSNLSNLEMVAKNTMKTEYTIKKDTEILK